MSLDSIRTLERFPYLAVTDWCFYQCIWKAAWFMIVFVPVKTSWKLLHLNLVFEVIWVPGPWSLILGSRINHLWLPLRWALCFLRWWFNFETQKGFKTYKHLHHVKHGLLSKTSSTIQLTLGHRCYRKWLIKHCTSQGSFCLVAPTSSHPLCQCPLSTCRDGGRMSVSGWCWD